MQIKLASPITHRRISPYIRKSPATGTQSHRLLSSTSKVRKFTTVVIYQNPNNGEEATQQRPNVLNQNWVGNGMGRLQIQRKSNGFQTSSFLLLRVRSLFTPSSFFSINFSFNFYFFLLISLFLFWFIQTYVYSVRVSSLYTWWQRLRCYVSIFLI